MKFCTECGTPVPDDITKFCTNCGANLLDPSIKQKDQNGSESLRDTSQQISTEISKNPEKNRSVLGWIGICCGGAILIVVLFAILSSLFIPNIPGPYKPPTPQTKCILPSDPPVITKNQTYPYVINGQKGSIELTLNKQLNDYYICRSKEIGYFSSISYTNITTCNLFSCNSSNTTTKKGPMEFINESKKYSALKPLIDAIKSKSTDPGMQARIAINLVQHIPYNCAKAKSISAANFTPSGLIHFYSPYEVLYENTGICNEKSLLLASLLNDLGYESAYIDFETDHHTMTGISGSGDDEYQNTDFILIESTIPAPIGFYSAKKSDPEVMALSGGFIKFYLNNQDRIDLQNYKKLYNKKKAGIPLSNNEVFSINNLLLKYGKVGEDCIL